MFTAIFKDEARELDTEKAALASEMKDEERASEYFGVMKHLERTREEIRSVIQRPEHCLPYLQVKTLLLSCACIGYCVRVVLARVLPAQNTSCCPHSVLHSSLWWSL